MTTFITDVCKEVLLYLKLAVLLLFVAAAVLFWHGNRLEASSYVFVREANRVMGIRTDTSWGEYQCFYEAIRFIAGRYAGNNPVSMAENTKYLSDIGILTSAYQPSNNSQLNTIIDGLKEMEFSQSSGSIKLRQKLDSKKDLMAMHYYDFMYTMKNESPLVLCFLLVLLSAMPLVMAMEIALQLIGRYEDSCVDENDFMEGEEDYEQSI